MVVHRQDDDLGCGRSGLDLLDQGGPIDVRKFDIQDDDIRFASGKVFHQLLRRARFADYLYIVAFRKAAAQPFPEHGMVIHKHNSDHDEPPIPILRSTVFPRRSYCPAP